MKGEAKGELTREDEADRVVLEDLLCVPENGAGGGRSQATLLPDDSPTAPLPNGDGGDRAVVVGARVLTCDTGVRGDGGARTAVGDDGV